MPDYQSLWTDGESLTCIGHKLAGCSGSTKNSDGERSLQNNSWGYDTLYSVLYSRYHFPGAVYIIWIVQRQGGMSKHRAMK